MTQIVFIAFQVAGVFLAVGLCVVVVAGCAQLIKFAIKDFKK